MRLLCVIFPLLSFVVSASADKVDSYLKEQMKKAQIPRLAVLVVRDSKIIKTGTYGYANVELKTPVSKKTVFELGAVTKQFTAAGILLLAQDGKLSLDDKINRYLKDPQPSWNNITIRHLLNHTSALKSYTDITNGFELTRHLTEREFVEKINAYTLQFQPGERFKYGNTGYYLLGRIIENVSGQKYWDFLHERIFKPLGMQASGDRNPDRLIPNRADGYEKNNYGKLVNRDYNITDFFAAGGMAANLEDLAKWEAALHSDRLLKASSKEQMWSPTKLKDGSTKQYGFGWGLESTGHKNYGHSGDTSGFSASFQMFPDDHLTVIVLCNLGEESLASILADKVAAFYLPK